MLYGMDVFGRNSTEVAELERKYFAETGASYEDKNSVLRREADLIRDWLR